MHALTMPEKTMRRTARRLRGFHQWFEHVKDARIPGYQDLPLDAVIAALEGAASMLENAFEISRRGEP